MVVTGTSPETARVASGLGLSCAPAASSGPAIVVVASRADVDDVVRAARHDPGAVAAAVALRISETDALALYDAGLAVAFGFCTREELDASIARAPDASARALTCALAALEVAL